MLGPSPNSIFIMEFNNNWGWDGPPYQSRTAPLWSYIATPFLAYVGGLQLDEHEQGSLSRWFEQLFSADCWPDLALACGGKALRTQERKLKEKASAKLQAEAKKPKPKKRRPAENQEDTTASGVQPTQVPASTGRGEISHQVEEGDVKREGSSTKRKKSRAGTTVKSERLEPEARVKQEGKVEEGE
jgi:hypothetical protein